MSRNETTGFGWAGGTAHTKVPVIQLTFSSMEFKNILLKHRERKILFYWLFDAQMREKSYWLVSVITSLPLILSSTVTESVFSVIKWVKF